MSTPRPTLRLGTSPHLRSPIGTETIMRHVVWSLLPTAVFAVWLFGLAGLLIISVTTASCLVTEWALCRFAGRPSTLGDWSAVITGLLLGLTLPPTLPLWMAAFGGFVAIAVAKALFGGLGGNPLNPALVGRAVLMAAFPQPLATWMAPLGEGRFSGLPSSTMTPPFLAPVYDAVSGATPLGALKFDLVVTPLSDMASGFIGGSLGETGALLILLGGLYLAVRKMLDWRIPVAIFATVAAWTGLFRLIWPSTSASPVFHLLAGGLILGAVYMATDMVTSPVTSRGVWLYGILIGTVVVVIRRWGGLPEGVLYAILLGNAVSPLLDRVTQPKPFGTRQEAKA